MRNYFVTCFATVLLHLKTLYTTVTIRNTPMQQSIILLTAVGQRFLDVQSFLCGSFQTIVAEYIVSDVLISFELWLILEFLTELKWAWTLLTHCAIRSCFLLAEYWHSTVSWCWDRSADFAEYIRHYKFMLKTSIVHWNY